MVLTTADGSQQPIEKVTTSKAVMNFIVGPPMAAGLAGLLEVSIFHPFDTTSKRLMSHEGKVVIPSDPRGSLERLQEIILHQKSSQKDHHQATNSSSASASAAAAEGKNFDKQKKAPLRPVEVAK